MKKLLLLTLFVLVSCGKDLKDSSPAPSVVQPNVSIINKFHSDAGLHGINDLDFSALTIGLPVDVTSQCSGTQYGNSGLVNGVAEGHFLIDGAPDSGTLQYGHLPYLNPLDSLCRDLSKEGYTYFITGKNLRICMINYNFCADYVVVE